jgi:hypothetical protein
MVNANKKLSGQVAHYIYHNNTFCLTLAHHRDWRSWTGHKNSSELKDAIPMGNGKVKDQGYR